MDYEECLKKAYAEGLRDPVQVSILEIEAYQAGMRTERNRVMFLFRGLNKEKPMRAMDLWRYINKILDP